MAIWLLLLLAGRYTGFEISRQPSQLPGLREAAIPIEPNQIQSPALSIELRRPISSNPAPSQHTTYPPQHFTNGLDNVSPACDWFGKSGLVAAELPIYCHALCQVYQSSLLEIVVQNPPEKVHKKAANDRLSNSRIISRGRNLNEESLSDGVSDLENPGVSSAEAIEACPICLVDFDLADGKTGKQDWKMLHNKHRFHPACIDVWLQTHHTCPSCRQNVSDEAAVVRQVENNRRHQTTADVILVLMWIVATGMVLKFSPLYYDF